VDPVIEEILSKVQSNKKEVCKKKTSKKLVGSCSKKEKSSIQLSDIFTNASDKKLQKKSTLDFEQNKEKFFKIILDNL